LHVSTLGKLSRMVRARLKIWSPAQISISELCVERARALAFATAVTGRKGVTCGRLHAGAPISLEDNLQGECQNFSGKLPEFVWFTYGAVSLMDYGRSSGYNSRRKCLAPSHKSRPPHSPKAGDGWGLSGRPCCWQLRPPVEPLLFFSFVRWEAVLGQANALTEDGRRLGPGQGGLTYAVLPTCPLFIWCDCATGGGSGAQPAFGIIYRF
jgi:hypothetical protein